MRQEAALAMVRMHRVHIKTVRAIPSRTTVVFWTLGRQRRFVFRSEWLTLWPATGALPQTSQREAKPIPPFMPAAISGMMWAAS